MLTTIQIPEVMRRKLKVLAAYRGISYSDLLEDFIDLYEATIPFKNEEEFRTWFTRNLEKFNFKKILEAKPPTYLIEDQKGKSLKVNLEYTGKDLGRKGNKIPEFDLIICIFSPVDKIMNIPVLPLIKLDKDPENLIKVIEGRSTPISIPISLYQRVRDAIEGTGFSSISAYVTFILREILAEHGLRGEEEISKEDEEKVKQRLKSLGYL